MKKIIYISSFVLLFLTLSCTKFIDIEGLFSDGNENSGIVVDGFIINGLDIPPTVRLTRTQGALKIANKELINPPVLGATVYITSSKDNYKKQIVLSELVLDKFINLNAITISAEEKKGLELLGYYAFTGNMTTLDIQSGYNYRLTIEADGKTYIAEDRMPAVKRNTTSPLFAPPFGLKFTTPDKMNFFIKRHHFGFKDALNFYITEVNLIKDIKKIKYNDHSYKFDFSNANTWTGKLNGFMLFNSQSRKEITYDVYLLKMKTIYTHPNLLVEASFPFSTTDNSSINLVDNLFDITKFSISDEYYNYKKNIFRESEWRSLFSTPPSNIMGNVEGAYGFFFASEAVTEEFDTRTFSEDK